MKQTQALEKRQRDRLAKQRGNANAKKIAVRKAAARRAADKVVSDAQKRSEAAERALEVKKQNSLKMSLEMKGVAQANLEAGEAAKAKRDVSRKDRADETRREAATRANANANLKKQRDAAVAQAQAMEKQQRDAVMMQKANANAKKAAAQKAEAINMANKVVSDAEKHTEAVKSAKEAKKSAEMKAIAQANVNAAKAKRNEQAAAAAKAERDRSSTFAKNKQDVQKRRG
tara:strand:- start:359 stop:1048 length:690 start_codon:yes stop_codon:yes gene_type:complete